jgi:hypothetical protein
VLAAPTSTTCGAELGRSERASSLQRFRLFVKTEEEVNAISKEG